jgi:hypothetical protein
VKVSGLIAFVSAVAHNGDINDPIATAHAAFMVTRVSQDAAARARSEIEAGTTPISRVEKTGDPA